MIPVTDLRAGVCFKDRGEPFQVLEYRHVKMGRGNANIKVKAKNLKTGATLEKTFMSGAKVDEVEVNKKNVQFLYSDQTAHFMDTETFEQYSVAKDILGSGVAFLKEGLKVKILEFEDEVIGVELPRSVDLAVTQTGPNEKGDSSTSVTKPATLETGAVIQVPMFIKEQDLIKVDTENGHYVERAKAV